MAKARREGRRRDARRRRKGWIFFVALAALIFAEAGYLLVPLGAVNRLLDRLLGRQTLTYDDFLSDVAAWRLVNGSWVRADLGRPGSAYIYVVTSDRLTDLVLARATADSARAPTFLFLLDPFYTSMGPEDVIRGINSTLYPLGGRLALLFPITPDPARSRALGWAVQAAEASGYIQQPVSLSQFPQYVPYRIEVRNGTVVSVVGVV